MDPLTALKLVPLAAWTFPLAAIRPVYVDRARRRLTWALEAFGDGRGA